MQGLWLGERSVGGLDPYSLWIISAIAIILLFGGYLPRDMTLEYTVCPLLPSCGSFFTSLVVKYLFC